MNKKQEIAETNVITADELNALLNQKEPLQFIDLRMPIDSDILPFSEILKIPVFDLEAQIDKISRSSKVILICKHGVDSFFAATLLQTKFQLNNVYSLKGGIVNWNL